MSTTDTHRVWDDVVCDEDRLVAARFSRRPTWGDRPALLLVDCYQKVFGRPGRTLAEALADDAAACGPAAWRALPRLETLLGRARAAGVPVLHATRETRDESRLGGATQRARPSSDDDGGYEFVPSLAPAPGELVVRKARASAFFDTPLATWLRQLGVDSLVVAGETTSGCVRASVVDAFSHGFDVAVAEDAVFDRSPTAHAMNLFDLHLKYASVVSADQAALLLAPSTSR